MGFISLFWNPTKTRFCRAHWSDSLPTSLFRWLKSRSWIQILPRSYRIPDRNLFCSFCRFVHLLGYSSTGTMLTSQLSWESFWKTHGCHPQRCWVAPRRLHEESGQVFWAFNLFSRTQRTYWMASCPLCFVQNHCHLNWARFCFSSKIYKYNPNPLWEKPVRSTYWKRYLGSWRQNLW